MDFKYLDEMIVKREDELVIDDIISIYKNEYKDYEDYINCKRHIQEEVDCHNNEMFESCRTEEEVEECRKFMWLNPIILSYEIFYYIKSRDESIKSEKNLTDLLIEKVEKGEEI